MNAFLWRLINTHVWSRKRPAWTLHELTGEHYHPVHWRRLLSRPGWFVAFVKYDQRKEGAK